MKKAEPLGAKYRGFRFLDAPKCFFEQVSGEFRPVWQIVRYAGGIRWVGAKEVVTSVTIDDHWFDPSRNPCIEALDGAIVHDFLSRLGCIILECGYETQPDGSLRRLVQLDYARLYELNRVGA